jgi:3-hydroxyisobutyrate dehydrogenase
MITILGTGLLGSGFARALLRKGDAVHVWNRSPDKARALEADGAKAFAEPAGATRGASRVHVVLSDDAAVDGVLALAHAGLPPGVRIYDHSTTSTAGARRRTAAIAGYLHAPVFMGPQNAQESTGLMMVSGDRAAVAAATPVLAPMTGKLVDLGPRVDAAAAFKLLGNLFLMALTAGFTDMLALGRAMGVEPKDVATLFDHFNPGASVPTRFKRMTDADYDHPSWTLAMARKDAGLMQGEAATGGVPLTMLPALVTRMDDMIQRGFREADWTVVAKDLIR